MVATILAPAHEESRPIDLEPKSTYEVITREKVEQFEDELKEIRNRVNSIFYLVIGSVLLDVLPRWLG